MKTTKRTFKNGASTSSEDINIEEMKVMNPYKAKVHMAWAGIIYYALTVFLILGLAGKI